jgi:kinesin family protein C1
MGGAGRVQADVFAEVSQLVQSALDGYKVCLFSYGQTGAGKTHTMLGCGTGEQRGVIPRAVEKVLEQADVLREKVGRSVGRAHCLQTHPLGLVV